jgi:hypothetical protein
MNAQPLILVVDDDREIRTLLLEYRRRQLSYGGGGGRRSDVESSRRDAHRPDRSRSHDAREDGLQLRTLRAARICR